MENKTQSCVKVTAREKISPIILEHKEQTICEKPATKSEPDENQEKLHWWQMGQYA